MKKENKIELISSEDEKIDLNVIPQYFFILNTFALFSFLYLVS